MPVHLAAYAAGAGSPPPWGEAEEARLYAALRALEAAGLEHPFRGPSSPGQERAFLSRWAPAWTLVLTLLPETMSRLARDPLFGLASRDEAGRGRALAFAEEARAFALRMSALAGRPAVRAVLLHSAPRAGESSPDSLRRSLGELRARDWGGASLLVEHCDAPRPGRTPEKGFLRIEEELSALSASRGAAPAGLCVNWGRSAVEGRRAETPLEHIRLARNAGLLGALFFSGTAAGHPLYGDWRDSHAPPSPVVPGSLLDPAALSASLAEAGPGPLLGLKVQPLPASLSPEERAAVVAESLRLLRAAGQR